MINPAVEAGELLLLAIFKAVELLKGQVPQGDDQDLSVFYAKIIDGSPVDRHLFNLARCIHAIEVGTVAFGTDKIEEARVRLQPLPSAIAAVGTNCTPGGQVKIWCDQFLDSIVDAH